MWELRDKVVLVTGSARRVGRAIALEFAKQGAHLVIHHNSSPAEAATAVSEAQALGVSAIACQADQANPAEVEQLFATIQAHYGRLDVLVNSAANFKKTPLMDISFDEWQEVIGVNLTGPWLCTQHAARMMSAQGTGGAIINISDISGLHPWKTRPHHSISKAGVVMLTKAAAAALGHYQIRVNCVIPGPVLAPPDESEAGWQKAIAGLPLNRGGEPLDVATACVFLAQSEFISGAILTVDGGESVATKK